MGVNQGDAGLFLHEVAHGGEQGDVFEHIGMVARVESVSVTEHRLMVTKNFRKSLIIRIMAGFAAIQWPRGEDAKTLWVSAISHLRGSQQRNTDRGKGPDKPFFKEKTHDNYFQRQTR
jgi:hypothetical protein